MPILYNFHILLATFYTIFETNILIQCPVPVPVCCIFFVSQKIHIKRSPNGIKMDGEYFWNTCEIWKRINARRCPRGPRGRGARLPPGRAPDPRGPPIRWLLLFFVRKKANFRRKIWAKVSIQSELRISGYIRNGERAESQNAETERDRGRRIQSWRGPRPPHAMGAKDQRRNPSPI